MYKRLPQLVLGLLALLALVGIVVGGAYAGITIFRHFTHEINGGSSKVTVRSAATQWGALALSHLGIQTTSPVRCTLSGSTSSRDAFAISCKAALRAGGIVTIESQTARFRVEERPPAGKSGEFVLGPWFVSGPGLRIHHLDCLPSSWELPRPCEPNAR